MADLVRVTCRDCRKRSEIMASDDDSVESVVWVCPEPLESGELCGWVNTLRRG